ncbi:MAG: hypothetical protein F9K40_17535 [Kofleriaceae bacterium]|nr:MAG: hypothetical protein F9K40_17535 [Kofleriaceae bacterium]MBZ0234532.1 hypothetical protein [Kofleriaceae bacterium]
MRRASLVVVAVLGAGAGCGDEGVTWRIPCGGTGQYSDEAAVSETYRFEGDDAGHVTLEELTRGDIITLATSRYEGDVRVAHTYDDGTIAYQETATVVGGRKAVVTRTGSQAEHRFVETWAWQDDRPAGWVRDHENLVDAEGVFGTGGGALIENVCARSDTGMLSDCNSLRYTGPYERWTVRERDDNSDGTPEGVELRTFDDHGLELSSQRRFGGADGRETLSLEVRTEREADGSPIRRLTSTYQPGFERTHTLVYSYACP